MRIAIRSAVAACVLALVAGCVLPLLAGCGRQETARASAEAAALAAPEWLFPVWVKGKWGFIDQTGRMRIEPQFDETRGFSRRAMLLAASIGQPWTADESWKPGGEDAPLAKSLAPVKVGGKWGYINANGCMVIAPQFDMASWFSEGRAAANLGGQFVNNEAVEGGTWGYIDNTGEWVVKPQFEDAQDFQEGLARVCLRCGVPVAKRKYGFIDKQGGWAIRPVLEGAGKQFSSGLVPVKVVKQEEEWWGYMDKTGRFAIPPQLKWGSVFSEGLAWVITHKCTGNGIQRNDVFINPSGVPEGELEYPYAGPFSGGLAVVSEECYSDLFGCYPTGFWGYIDKTGKVVIPFKYYDVGGFSEGLAAVQDGYSARRFAIFDEFRWDRVVDLGPDEGHGLKWGFIDKTGKFVIPPSFNYIYGGFYHGIAKVEKDGRTWYINKSGAVIWREEAAQPRLP